MTRQPSGLKRVFNGVPGAVGLFVILFLAVLGLYGVLHGLVGWSPAFSSKVIVVIFFVGWLFSLGAALVHYRRIFGGLKDRWQLWLRPTVILVPGVNLALAFAAHPLLKPKAFASVVALVLSALLAVNAERIDGLRNSFRSHGTSWAAAQHPPLPETFREHSRGWHVYRYICCSQLFRPGGWKTAASLFTIYAALPHPPTWLIYCFPVGMVVVLATEPPHPDDPDEPPACPICGSRKLTDESAGRSR